MATLASTLPAATAIESTARGCFHCGATLPSAPTRLTLDGVARAFCCGGCAAAAQWIDDAQLDDYYRLRSQPGARIDPDAADLALWDRAEVLAEHARDIAQGKTALREITLLTDGMRCAACAWLIDRALAREPGVFEVCANAVTGRIRIAWDPQRTPLSRPLQRLLALGYRPYLASGEARERARRSERNRWLIRLGVAGLGAMQAMMFAEALYLDTAGQMPLPTRDFLRWVTLLVSTPVVFYAGWPFLAGACHELRGRRLGMDTLIASSTLLAYFASVAETLRGGPHVWYDAAVMFVFLLLTARMLEQRVRSVASAQIDALARARPAFATRERDGGRETVPLSALAIGDTVRVAVGEVVPADGTLLGASARFEESLLTGEPQAVVKHHGDAVYAGTCCREQPARLRLTAVGAATRLSQLAALVEQAQAHRPAIARTADRIAAAFVAALLLSALALYAFWRNHDPARALEVTLAWLVISCPCALSLAVPAALAAANGALARLGVLPVRADALERLAAVDDIVFDKTGTLSDGRPRLAEVTTYNGSDRAQALRIAAALERDSGHPLAVAFSALEAPASNDEPEGTPSRAAFARGLHSAAPLHAEAVTAVPGHGIEGDIAGVRWRLGQATFAYGGADDGALWLGDGQRAVARFVIAEHERDDAAAAIQALQCQSLDVHLSSGDAGAAVARLAANIGITAVQARQTPESKLAYVRALQARGHRVAMVGDGLNDAPVLAGADVSIAIGDGAALAQRAADLVLTAPALTRIPDAIVLARRTRRIIRQNLAWALGYNLLALPLAALGLVTPWLAALGMTVSSLTVTLNALRLSRLDGKIAP